MQVKKKGRMGRWGLRISINKELGLSLAELREGLKRSQSKCLVGATIKKLGRFNRQRDENKGDLLIKGWYTDPNMWAAADELHEILTAIINRKLDSLQKGEKVIAYPD